MIQYGMNFYFFQVGTDFSILFRGKGGCLKDSITLLFICCELNTIFCLLKE